MTCSRTDIKELFPAYLNGLLDRSQEAQIKEHCRDCEDCAGEGEILRMLAEEPVPDPGEAFWATMPARIERAVAEERARRPAVGPARLFGRTVFPRAVWATAAALLLAALVWPLVRQEPSPGSAAVTSPDERLTLEEALALEPVLVTELSTSDLHAVSRWADSALGPIHREIAGHAERADQELSEALSLLGDEELDRLEELLQGKEKELRERLKGPEKQRTTGRSRTPEEYLLFTSCGRYSV